MIIWNDEYTTGNIVIDNQHKKLVSFVNELYVLLEDTKTFSSQIKELTTMIEIMLLEHIDVENELFEKAQISNYIEHKENHDKFITMILEIKNFKLSPIIRALMIGDILIRYFMEHFFVFDKASIAEFNNKNTDK